MMITAATTFLRPNPAMPRSPPTVLAGLSYLKATTEVPCSYAYEPPPGTPWENSEYLLQEMPIADARRAAHSSSIDREGFELRDAPTAVKDFLDEDAVRTIYYREASELALAVTGAQHAYVFDHLVRRREADRAALSFGRRGTDGRAAANGRIHTPRRRGESGSVWC